MKNLMNFFGDGNPHMEKFVPTEIGKYYHVAESSHNLSEGFYVITGYDFFNDIYLSQNLERNFWGHYVIVPSNVSTLTLQESIEKVKYIINSKQESVDRYNDNPIFQNKELKNENYIYEFEKIFISYKETSEQLEAIQICLDGEAAPKSLYESEKRKALRGLRKMRKRFHFFYGDKADEIIYLVDNGIYLEDIQYQQHMLKNSIRFYNGILETLKREQRKEISNEDIG